MNTIICRGCRKPILSKENHGWVHGNCSDYVVCSGCLELIKRNPKGYTIKSGFIESLPCRSVDLEPQRENVMDDYERIRGTTVEVISVNGDFVCHFVRHCNLTVKDRWNKIWDAIAHFNDDIKPGVELIVNEVGFKNCLYVSVIPIKNINSIKCECGGEKARTTHSSWCPKY